MIAGTTLEANCVTHPPPDFLAHTPSHPFGQSARGHSTRLDDQHLLSADSVAPDGYSGRFPTSGRSREDKASPGLEISENALKTSLELLDR